MRFDRYRNLLDPESLAALEIAVQRPVPSAIRVNNLHISEPEARAIWAERYGSRCRFAPSVGRLPDRNAALLLPPGRFCCCKTSWGDSWDGVNYYQIGFGISDLKS